MESEAEDMCQWWKRMILGGMRNYSVDKKEIKSCIQDELHCNNKDLDEEDCTSEVYLLKLSSSRIMV